MLRKKSPPDLGGLFSDLFLIDKPREAFNCPARDVVVDVCLDRVSDAVFEKRLRQWGLIGEVIFLRVGIPCSEYGTSEAFALVRRQSDDASDADLVGGGGVEVDDVRR